MKGDAGSEYAATTSIKKELQHEDIVTEIMITMFSEVLPNIN